MRILFLCQDDPRLQGSGSLQRTHYLWLSLKRLGSVYTLCPNIPNGEDISEHIGYMSDEGGGNCLVRVVRKAAIRLVGYMAWFILPKRITIPKAWGIALCDFDVIVSRYMWRGGSTLAWRYAKCYIDVDDLPSKAVKIMRSKNESKLWLSYRTFLTKHWECMVARRCSGVWVADLSDGKALGSKVKSLELRNISRQPAVGYNINGRQKEIVLTVGYMGYPPNWRGVLWFCKNIWPAFSKQYKTWEYWIAGRDIPKEVELDLLNDKTIKILGYVDDLQECYECAAFVVAPILEGAGTCIKVEEACCYGRKIFGPEAAFRGMSSRVRKESMIEVFDDAASFVEKGSQWISRKDNWNALQDKISRDAIKRNSIDAFASQVGAMFV